jgi:hypothetical protein
LTWLETETAALPPEQALRIVDLHSFSADLDAVWSGGLRIGVRDDAAQVRLRVEAQSKAQNPFTFAHTIFIRLSCPIVQHGLARHRQRPIPRQTAGATRAHVQLAPQRPKLLARRSLSSVPM